MLFAGLMIIISAMHAEGTDLRPAPDAPSSASFQSQSRLATELTHQVTALRQQVDGLAARGDQESDLTPELSRQARRVGLTPVSGPAVTVTLDDAPSSVAANGIDPDLLVVHQQDIQAVVNALWSGGAEAMTIQDQRVISTTAVKCVGNTVVLHGIYSPPYVITAIGDQARLRATLANLSRSRSISNTWSPMDWSFAKSPSRRPALPGHEGSPELSHADRYTGFSEPTDSGTP